MGEKEMSALKLYKIFFVFFLCLFFLCSSPLRLNLLHLYHCHDSIENVELRVGGQGFSVDLLDLTEHMVSPAFLLPFLGVYGCLCVLSA